MALKSAFVRFMGGPIPLAICVFCIHWTLTIFVRLNTKFISKHPVSVASREDSVSKRDLLRALDSIEAVPDCVSLLRCLDQSLDVKIDNDSEYSQCRQYYDSCKRQEMLPLLTLVLNAVDAA